MDDQLDIGTLLGDEPTPSGLRPPLATPAKIDVLSRMLAGFRYPGRKKYEQLTAAQREACRHAAEQALTYLQDRTD